MIHWPAPVTIRGSDQEAQEDRTPGGVTGSGRVRGTVTLCPSHLGATAQDPALVRSEVPDGGTSCGTGYIVGTETGTVASAVVSVEPVAVHPALPGRLLLIRSLRESSCLSPLPSSGARSPWCEDPTGPRRSRGTSHWATNGCGGPYSTGILLRRGYNGVSSPRSSG
ncbi:hypothetical protein UY3_03372 [Chelonia mydas]|uniref:Uncharacterized protein n=1 Tax=Chelonia mydas TaxID=8469 RepID=M7BUE6_CHEMY|nr:hypothetical protein UY3_03372 [Chelonia mydas]